MKDRSKYRKLFQQEAGKLLEAVAGSLLDLDVDPDQLGPLRRNLHTLKGSARIVDLEEVATLAHALEDFAVEGSPCARGETAAVDLALEVVDALEGLSGLDKPTPGPEELAALQRRMCGEEGSEAPGAEPQTPAEAAGGDGEVPASSASEPPPTPSPILPTASGGSAAPAPPPPQRAASPPGLLPTPGEQLQVPVEEVDHLLNLSGELLLQQHRMVARFDHGRQILRLVESMRRPGVDPAASLQELQGQVDRLTRQLETDMVEADFLFQEVRERTAAVRLQPFSTVLEPIQLQFRMDARRQGKEARLVVRGAGTEVDRSILAELRPLLLHTITNSLAHGIEAPEVRLRLGKPREGTVLVEVGVDGNRLEVVVEDDGGGLNPEFLRRATVQKGLLTREEAEEVGDEEALHLIFTPGFSTAEVVSGLAGRGVGMDAVRSGVERLRGQVLVESEQGRFTRLRFLFPAAIGLIRGLVVRVGDQEMVLPVGDVAATTYARLDEPEAPGEAFHLSELLGWGSPPRDLEGKRWWVHLKTLKGPRPLEVDEVVRDQDVVLKHPGSLLSLVPFVGGATVFPGGEVGLVLRVPDLLRELQTRLGATSLAPPPRPRRVLVADDCPVVRGQLRGLLEEEGYQVLEAGDGEEALEKIWQGPVDLVVTDFEMPGLDGIEVLERIRGTPEFRHLPVFFLSSRAGSIRARARASGAAGVFAKEEGWEGRLQAAVWAHLEGEDEGWNDLD